MVASPPNHPHKRLQAIYEAERAAYTAPLLVRTSKPRKKKVKPKEVEALKNRIESVEGEEIALETILKPTEIGKEQNRYGDIPKIEQDAVARFNGS